MRRRAVAGGGEACRRERAATSEKCDDEWHDERADRALAMEEFEAEIDQGEQPAE